MWAELTLPSLPLFDLALFLAIAVLVFEGRRLARQGSSRLRELMARRSRSAIAGGGAGVRADRADAALLAQTHTSVGVPHVESRGVIAGRPPGAYRGRLTLAVSAVVLLGVVVALGLRLGRLSAHPEAGR